MTRNNRIGALMILVMALWSLGVAGQKNAGEQQNLNQPNPNRQNTMNGRNVDEQNPNNQNNVSGGYYITRETFKPGQIIKLTDPEIASVAVTANQTDINNAKIAKKRSKNTDVLNFADMMIKDHQMILDQASTLVKKLNITPLDNPVSQQLNTDAEVTKKNLEKLSGRSFDMSYIDGEIKAHQSVITIVVNQLIPQAQNAELKSMLEQVVPTLKAHLESAQLVRKKLE